MGEDFSGTRADKSRNPLIHNGATNSTKSPRFGAEGLQHGLSSRGWRCVEEPFATLNFREFLFFPRTPVNKLDSWVLTVRPSRRISMSDNNIATTPNSRVAPGGGGPTRTQGSRGESLGRRSQPA
jgi:hypothetical protein